MNNIIIFSDEEDDDNDSLLNLTIYKKEIIKMDHDDEIHNEEKIADSDDIGFEVENEYNLDYDSELLDSNVYFKLLFFNYMQSRERRSCFIIEEVFELLNKSKRNFYSHTL